METGSEPPERFMQIGEVSQKTGLTQRALRYYESIGLLAPPSRMDGGFRLYSPHDVRRLEQIVKLKQLLGVSLAEIRQVVEADELLQQIKQENRQAQDPTERRARLEQAVGLIGRQIGLVTSRIGALEELRARYERRLGRVRGRIANIDATVQDEVLDEVLAPAGGD